MNSYLIITPNVCNMGGAQLYVLRRALYLVGKGYNVFVVIWFDNGFFPLEAQFKGIPIYFASELSKPFILVSKKKSDAIIRRIANFAKLDKNTIIESHTLSAIEWGEIISSQYNCKHLAYPLSEASVSNYIWLPGKKIFKEKLDNNEFYGLSDASLEIIFGKPHIPNNYVNVGFDEEELAERCIPNLNLGLKNNDFVISTIARLEKSYIEKLIEDTIKLAKAYRNQPFVLIIAGGSDTGKRQDFLVEKYKKIYDSCSNLRVFFTGYITTLGKDLFQISDVFVGTGLAAINAISQSRITVVIDERNDLSLGFLGVDAKNFGYGPLSMCCPIYNKLDEAYTADKEKKRMIMDAGRQLYFTEFYTQTCFEKLDVAISKISNSKDRDCMKVSLFNTVTLRTLKCLINLSRPLRKLIKRS